MSESTPTVFYVRHPGGGTSGPHSATWLENRASSGGIQADDLVAAVPTDRDPVDSDFKPATPGNLSSLVGKSAGTVATSRSGSSNPPGGFLRAAGGLIGALGIVAALFAAVVEGPYGSAEFNWAIAFAGIIEALFYGGLLWAAGTVVGELYTIRVATTRQ